MKQRKLKPAPVAPLDLAWEELSRPRNLLLMLAPPFNPLGVDERSFERRLERLQESPLGRRVEQLLDEAEEARIDRLFMLAAINLQRAEAGFRMTAVLNISGPLAIAIGWNELSPQTLALVNKFYADRGILEITIGLIIVLVLLAVSYAYRHARHAADLRDLLLLQRIRRGAPPLGLLDHLATQAEQPPLS